MENFNIFGRKKEKEKNKMDYYLTRQPPTLNTTNKSVVINDETIQYPLPQTLKFKCNNYLDFQANKVIEHELLKEFIEYYTINYFKPNIFTSMDTYFNIPKFMLFVDFIIGKYYHDENNTIQVEHNIDQEEILKFIGRKYYEIQRMLTKQETIDIIGKFYLSHI